MLDEKFEKIVKLYPTSSNTIQHDLIVLFKQVKHIVSIWMVLKD